MRDAGEVVLQAQGLDDLPGAGPHADAGADLGEVARGLVDVDLDHLCTIGPAPFAHVTNATMSGLEVLAGDVLPSFPALVRLTIVCAFR